MASCVNGRKATADMPLMRRVERIHFVGIGGAGMCGIAEVLLNEGYNISGSDLVESDVTARQRSLGAAVEIGHDASHVRDVDVVVVSSAIRDDNPEIVEAHRLRIPVVSRAEMLGELMRHRHGIAVAGTHGKTTATSLITSIFQAASLDPTYVIGGLLNSEGRHARLGAGQYLIAEADESDASFLYLNPKLAVITNLDRDHLGTYSQDFDEMCRVFSEFIHRLPFYGAVILCIDDPVLRSMTSDLSRPVVTYGFSDDADYKAEDLRVRGTNVCFRVQRPADLPPLDLELCLPGEQNVRNALAAVAVASDEGVGDEFIIEGIHEFQGINRRFELSNLAVDGGAVTMIDDYGHHPTEVRHVIQTSRELFSQRRIVMVYQPHRYTRTRDLFDEFVDVLVDVDVLILVDTYAASEIPIAGADAADLAQSIQRTGGVILHFACTPQQAAEFALRTLEPNDVVVVQGAGSVDQVSVRLKEALS